MSHTLKIKVELKNKIALGRSVVELKGVVLGEGQHRLYQGIEDGYGFTLPAWTYPLVLKEGGELVFDDFGGHWGDKADISRIMELYAMQTAKIAAEAQGWPTESVGGGLVVYHPSGGTLTITANGVLDAQNFLGSGCASATQAIEAALGTRQEETLKDEYFQERAHIAAHE